MTEPVRERSMVGPALSGIGFTLIGLALIGALYVGYLVFYGGDPRDATPAAVLNMEAGEEVWLRGMRDRDRPQTIADRVLFPTREQPRVFVDCANTGCEGSLIGAIEEPDGLGSGEIAKIVVVGRLGDERKARLLFVGGASGVFLVLGILSVVVGHRRRA